MKRILRYLLLIVLVVAAAAGGYRVYRNRVSPVSSAASGLTQVVAVRQGNLTTNITVVAELEAEQSSDMTFSRMKGTAKLLSLSVTAGNTVKAGQALAAIDPAPYQQVVDQAKSSLQAAEQKLADLKAPATKLAMAKADLAVAKTELQLSQAQDDLDNALQPDLANLQSAVADAERSLAQAQVSLATLQADKSTEDNLARLRDTEAKALTQYNRLASETTPGSDAYYQDRLQLSLNALRNAQDARITAETQQQVNLLKAQMQVNKAKQTLADAQDALATAQAGGDKLALAKAQVAVQDAQVALATAQDSRAELAQGTDATTLAAAQADVDKKRLAVANMKTLQVVANVDETTIRRVSVGQTAQVTFDALPGQTVRGKVASVPLQGALQGNVMVYEVPITLTGAEDLTLLVGMTANVQIQTGQATNALLIPALAIKQVGNAYQVQVPSADPAGQPETVPVEIGLSDGVNTQITSGLNLGDKVVVQYQTSTSSSTQNQGNQPGFNAQFIGVEVPPGMPPGGGVIIQQGPGR